MQVDHLAGSSFSSMNSAGIFTVFPADGIKSTIAFLDTPLVLRNCGIVFVINKGDVALSKYKIFHMLSVAHLN